MNLGSSEIVNIVDALARDRGISKEYLISGIEHAIEEVGIKKYGTTNPIRARLNRKTGEISVYRVLRVVDLLEDYTTQILLEDALKQNSEVNVGDEFYDLLPPIDLGRNEANIARYVISSAVQRAERDKEYNDFIGRVGEIITGVVKRVEFGHIIIDLGRTEALLKRDQLISTDRFKVGDRVKSYIQDVRREDYGAQIFLSRASDQMLAKLFEMEVPEMYDGLIQIKGVARDPGSKAKIAVFATDSNTDAVACCVGIRGMRVKSIMEELSGERIDVVSWNSDLAKYVVNLLGLPKDTKVLVDRDANRVEVVVNNDQLSLAIGRGGQNVKLASKIARCNIDVLTEEKESKRRLEEFHSVSQILIQELDLDETLGQFLVAKGFSSVEQIANTELSFLMTIEGFDEDLAVELLERATTSLNKKKEVLMKSINDLGVEESVIEFLNFIDLKTILLLAERGIKSLEDIACTTPDDFKKMLPRNSMSDVDIVAIVEEAKAKTVQNKV
jgi:N utilization substance protein A